MNYLWVCPEVSQVLYTYASCLFLNVDWLVPDTFEVKWGSEVITQKTVSPPAPIPANWFTFLAYLCRPSCSPDDRPNKTSFICIPIAGAMCG